MWFDIKTKLRLRRILRIVPLDKGLGIAYNGSVTQNKPILQPPHPRRVKDRGRKKMKHFVLFYLDTKEGWQEFISTLREHRTTPVWHGPAGDYVIGFDWEFDDENPSVTEYEFVGTGQDLLNEIEPD